MSGGSLMIPLYTAIIFILLIMYVVLGGFMEHKHVSFGHETGVALVMGLIISACIHFFLGAENDIPFNATVFFYVCLPPIIFASGFNMRRRRFFANIGYILFFGVAGTIFTFIIFSGLNYLVMYIDFMQMYNATTQAMEPLKLDFFECLVISSLLCSSDVIAAISIVKYEEQPKLFSIIFGEGIVNDAVALILFQTVAKVATESKSTTGV